MTDKFIFSGLYYLMNRKAIRKYALIKLYNEINFNLKIIDVLKWKGITDFEKLRLCSHFRTNDIEEYLKFISTDILDAILRDDENLHEFKGDEGQEKYGSVINKIETLKLIFSQGEEFFNSNNQIRLDIRISNIHDQLLELRSILRSAKV